MEKLNTMIARAPGHCLNSNLNQTQMPKDKRQKRDLHALDENGMVLCNSRDKEAAHRAEVEGIATENWELVTCCKCLLLIYRYKKAQEEDKEQG
jgi:hypothetical protein